MGIIRKQSTYATLLLYSGIIIGFIGTAVIRPKILAPDEIGFLQVVLNMTTFLGGAFTLGANLVTIKMLPRFRTEDNTNRGLLRLILTLGFFGSLLGIPTLLFGESLFLQNNAGERFANFQYSFLFYVVLFLVIAMRTFSNLLDNYLRGYHVSVPGVFSDNIVLKSLPILALLFFYLQWINFTFLVYFNLLIYAIPLLIGWYYLKRLDAIKWVKPGPFTSEEKKEMRQVLLVGFMEIISFFIVLFIDVFMLKRLMNDEAVGIYATMFYFGAVVSVPLKALVRIAHPIISDSFAKQDLVNIQKIYRKSSNVLFLMGAFVFLLVWENRYSIEHFLDSVYAQGIWVIFFIGLAHLVDMLSSVNYQIISISPFYRFNLYMGIITILLLIATNYLFINRYGLVGAAVGSLISMILVNSARYLFLIVKYRMSPFSFDSLKIMLLFAGVFLISELVPNVSNLFVNAALKSTLIAVCFIPSAYFLKCSEDFNQVIDKYLNKLRK
jgi:O-antigen/teichoic acid export membrane protein